MRELHLDQLREQRDGDQVVPADLVQPAVQASGGERGLAAGHVQGDHGLDSLGKILAPTEQLLGLLQPPLGHAEGREARGRMHAPGPLPAPLELPERSGEPHLAVLPLAGREQDLGAAGAAEREQIRVAGALHEAHDDARPLLEPADVQRDLCGEVGRAVQVAQGAKIGGFAGRAGGHDLVEAGHALVDPAQRDLREPGPAQRGELEVGVARSPGDGERPRGVIERVGGVDSSFGLQEGHPAPLG